jgi:hypothetical protein
VNRRRFLQLLTGSAAGIALAPTLDLAQLLDRSPSVLLASERRIIEPWLLEPGWITRRMLEYLDAALADARRLVPLADHGWRRGDHLAYSVPVTAPVAVTFDPFAFQRLPFSMSREVALDQQPFVRTVVTDKEQALMSRDEFTQRILQPAAWALAQYVRDHRLDVFAPLDVPECMRSPDLPVLGVRASSPRGFPLRTLLRLRPDRRFTELSFDTLAGSTARYV